MKVNLGNIIMTPDGIKIVDFTTGSLIGCDCKHYLFDEIDGIPLSISWLKKAGYKQLKRVEKTYSLADYEDNSAIMFTGVRFIHIRTQTELNFVHEWQNLYSAIFKKELQFNL